MNLSDFFDFFQPCSSQTANETDFESLDSLDTFSQSAVSNINDMLLQVLFPSEDTIRTYLYPEQQKNRGNDNTECDQSTNSSNEETIANLTLYRVHFGTSNQLRPIRSQFDHFNSYDLASADIYSDTINQLVCHLVHQNNINLEALDYFEYDNSTLYQHYDDYRASKSNQLFTYNDYVKLRANTLLLARLGYKLTLTLNTDNDKVKETWNPNVAQKMLAVEYSPLNVKKDYAPTKAPLDQFESLLLAEALNAFQSDEQINFPDFSSKLHSYFRPSKLIYICKNIKSFRKICKNDKVVLLSNAFYEILSFGTIFNYNLLTDDWTCPEFSTRFDRRDLFLWNRPFHDLSVPIIEKLPDRWRRDETVEALLFLIIIFNPDQAGLLQPDRVRYEQYVYIHLLKRYLELVCESPCDASDNHYRLMVGVEHFRELGKIICKSMDAFEVGFCRSLQNWISDAINYE